jgi:putative oligomerization/nucleic acid binding protein
VTNEPQPTISAKYRGKKGMQQFQLDAARHASDGYVIASQVQTPGGRTCAASGFVVVGVLFLLLGLLFPPLWAFALVCLVIGLVSGRSPSELAVVWRHDAPAAPAPAQAPVVSSPAPSNPLEAMDALAAMRDRGMITAEEYEAKKAELLGRM